MQLLRNRRFGNNKKNSLSREKAAKKIRKAIIAENTKKKADSLEVVEGEIVSAE